MGDAKKICLIDDEKDFTELTGTLLGFHGFQVEAINNPVVGLERLKQASFDVVVVDIMMPQMNGLDLMEKLRAEEAYAKTPIFALSAKKLSDEERKFLLTNDIHFVQKPFTPRRLVDLIRETLG
ncbi:MAG: response regulator [Elusimicrobiota bacterium]